ncbi:MAG: DUF4258 domain-containing protein [bacterium]|nr:DUF4258 domain-containing protein [bacterium]
MSRTYKNLIFTDHALERMRLRRISQAMIASAVQAPDAREKEADGDTKFIKTIQRRPVHVVAHYETDEKKWLVKTVWVRGEDDPMPLWKRILLFPLRLLRGR